MQLLTLLGASVIGQAVVVLAKWGNRDKFVFRVVFICLILTVMGCNCPVQSGPIVEFYGLTRWSGHWDSPNDYGLFMGVGMVLAAGMIALAGRQREASVSWIRMWEDVLVTCFCFLASLLTAFGLLHSLSRGAWVGTVCGFACLISSSKFRTGYREQSSLPGFQGVPLVVSRFKSNSLIGLVAFLSLLVISFWFVPETKSHLARRIFSIFNNVDFSQRNRLAAWEGALQITAENPVFGVGWNRPALLYGRYYLPSKLAEGGAIETNDYLMMGATLGILGLVSFLTYFGASSISKEDLSGNITSSIS